MKNIFVLLILLISSISISCQQIYPLNYSGKIETPSGSYFKDLDGELDPYVGLWKGSWNGKTIYIQFKKVKYLSGNLTDTHFIYFDDIFGERKIINSNGVVEIDRITNFNEQVPEFKGISSKFSNPAQKQLYFVPKNIVCGGITANLDVTFLDAAKTQMSLHLIYRPGYIDESCPYYNSIMQGNEPPINFPKDIVLTKQ